MNQTPIPVFEAKDQQLLCNARDLHVFLEVGRDFSNWIRGRIEQYGFVEGEDYLTVQNLSSPDPASSKSRSQQMIDYHLTIGMAKELAMIENNAMGRKVRRYFIQCERQAFELLKQQAIEIQPLEQVRERIKDTPKLRYLLILQEQSRATARELARCQDPREAFNLHCMLRQINNTLGIPTKPLEVWNTAQPPHSPALPHSE